MVKNIVGILYIIHEYIFMHAVLLYPSGVHWVYKTYQMNYHLVNRYASNTT